MLFWVLLWLLVGALTGLTVWRTADTGDTISTSGRALSSVGSTLQDLSKIPLIPKRPGEIGKEVSTTAQDITVRGQKIKHELHVLGVLLGVVVMVVPLAPVLGFYVPFRVGRRREIGRLRRALRSRPDDPGLDRYLADHARQTLSYTTVSALVDASRADPSTDELRRLADAELARLGLTRPAVG